MPSVTRTVAEVRSLVRSWKDQGETVGLVPTMGALHAGHLRLVEVARAACDRIVVSIFVNPTQFDRPDDLEIYPRDEADDLAKLDAAGADAAFCPGVDVLYPESFSTRIEQDGTTDHLCGATRPGHFAGVLTVVMKLLNIVGPDRAFFGQKDFQQVTVIRRMVADLDVPVEIVGVETVREPDGLAMSSRNALLTPRNRAEAPRIRSALLACRAAFAAGEASSAVLRSALLTALAAPDGARVDYVEICDPMSLLPRSDAAQDGDLVAVAVFLGEIRLIDNILLGSGPEA